MAWETIAGAGIGAAGDILGSIIGSNASSAAAANANRIQQNQFHEQMQWQKELAMSGISMRVNDAKAAGIHPLYAIGAPPASFSPISIGGNAVDNSGEIWARGLSNMGQNIGRAVAATQTRLERAKTILETEREHLLNEGLRADVEIKRSQLAQLRGQIGPPIPAGSNVGMSGPVATGALGQYQIQPYDVSASQPGKPEIAAGPATPYVEFTNVGDGLRPMPPKNLKVEDEFGAPQMALWITDVQANPHDYKPSRAQIHQKWGPGISEHEIIWDSKRQMWRPFRDTDMRAPTRPLSWRTFKEALFD